jgi:hypothetical protein
MRMLRVGLEIRLSEESVIKIYTCLNYTFSEHIKIIFRVAARIAL